MKLWSDAGRIRFFGCKIQAISLNTLDKYLLTLMTIYSIINYIGQFHIKFYQKNMKVLFITVISLGFCISLIFSIIYYIIGETDEFFGDICYIKNKGIAKRICDNFYASILFITNLFCLINLLFNMHKLINESINNINVEKESACRMHFKRFIIDIIINIFIFSYAFFIINKKFLDEQYPDLIYIILFFIIELFFTMNKQIFNIFVNIITCSKKKHENINSQRNTEGGYSIIDDVTEN